MSTLSSEILNVRRAVYVYLQACSHCSDHTFSFLLIKESSKPAEYFHVWFGADFVFSAYPHTIHGTVANICHSNGLNVGNFTIYGFDEHWESFLAKPAKRKYCDIPAILVKQ